MVAVLAAMAAVWGIGAIMGASTRPRLVMIGVIYAAVVLAHLTLPEGNGLRAATGESADPWLILGGAGLLIFAYRAGLGRLRAQALRRDGGGASAPVQTDGPFSALELERYARHITLPEIGGRGQKALKEARVLVIGAGGLGAPALIYLAAAGVGRIGVIDPDTVSLSNLQRQIIHRDADIDMPKVFSAQASMAALNPHIDIRPYHRALDRAIADDLFADHDLILDGCDNFETRQIVNAAAHRAGKPVIAGAISAWEGQITTYHSAAGGPCLACLFPHPPQRDLAATCAQTGVIGALPGVIGTMMALEAIKHLTGAGSGLQGRMVIFDGLGVEMRVVTCKTNPACPVCAAV